MTVMETTFVLPKEIELPELMVEKEDHPIIEELDIMITDKETVAECYKWVEREMHELRHQADKVTVDKNDKMQVQAIGLLTWIDAYTTFDKNVKAVAIELVEAFEDKYESDQDFRSDYSQKCEEAREQLVEEIPDSVLRRKVQSEVDNNYKRWSASASIDGIRRVLQKAEEGRKYDVETTLKSIEYEVMMTGATKNEETATILMQQRSKLKMMTNLITSEEDEVRVEKTLKSIEKKEGKMRDRFAAVHQGTKFPKRYFRAPANGETLEEAVKHMLEQDKGYTVAKVSIAGKWTDVKTRDRKQIGSQMDFHAAIAKNDDVIDIMYVIGRTENKEAETFETCFTGTVGEMLAENL